MAYKTKNGIILRTPTEKAKRFSRQLKSGVIRETGEKLSPTDKAFRAGYLQARTDGAKVHNANKGRRGKGRSAIKRKKR